MTPDHATLREIVDELSTSLEAAIVLAGRLATGLRADARDGDVVYDAITRARLALQRLRPNGGAQ